MWNPGKTPRPIYHDPTAAGAISTPDVFAVANGDARVLKYLERDFAACTGQKIFADGQLPVIRSPLIYHVCRLSAASLWDFGEASARG